VFFQEKSADRKISAGQPALRKRQYAGQPNRFPLASVHFHRNPVGRLFFCRTVGGFTRPV
jgi:hypothetical protein